jgi:hypothetical protein
VPLRLHGHVAGQADEAVVGPFAGGQRLPAGDRLGEREREVVRLAAAQAEADAAHPVLTREGDVEQVAGRGLALLPVPALVDDR